jgi:hypothetical protein
MIAAVLPLLAASAVLAQEPAEEAPPPLPRIGLALSGGGSTRRKS